MYLHINITPMENPDYYKVQIVRIFSKVGNTHNWLFIIMTLRDCLILNAFRKQNINSVQCGDGINCILLCPSSFKTNYIGKNLDFFFLCGENPVLSCCVSVLHFSFPSHTDHFTSDSFCHQMCGSFLHNKQFSVTPAGCPAIKLSSDTICLEKASDSRGKGSLL